MPGGDHDADLLDGLGELIRLDSAVVVQVEVLEGLEEHGLLVAVAGRLLGKLLLKRLLETEQHFRSAFCLVCDLPGLEPLHGSLLSVVDWIFICYNRLSRPPATSALAGPSK